METLNKLAVDCMPMPEFDKTSLEAVNEAFRDAASVELGQSWLSNRETKFRPGKVRIGWRDESLLVMAELDDDHIFSRASALNQKTWEMGDAFEIFLRPVQQSAYLEFHVTPNNHRLQLRFPDAQAVRDAQLSGDFASFFLEGNVIESFAWVRPGRSDGLYSRGFPPRLCVTPCNRWRGRTGSFRFAGYATMAGNPGCRSCLPARLIRKRIFTVNRRGG